MEDFVRVIPKQGYEKWPDKLGQMSQLFLDSEYQMVKGKFRKAAIILINPKDLQQRMEEINRAGLVLTPLRQVAYSQGYSLLTKDVKAGEPFLWKSCLTLNGKDAEIFKKAYAEDNHKVIGHLLGYPDCCINYFIKEFSVNPDPVWVGLEGKVAGYTECNTLLRYFGLRMTSHMPCSPKCEATKKIGKIYFEIMESINKDLAKEAYGLLSDPVTWDSYHGVVQVETPYFIGLSKTFPYLRKARIIQWSSLGSKKTIRSAR